MSASPAPPAGPGGMAPAAAVWTKAISPDGRPFWNNSITKQSVWEKPSELKTPAELEAEKTPWKEYEANGRSYWVHSETKETTWERPQIIQDILNRYVNSPVQPPLPTTPLPPHPSGMSPLGPGGFSPSPLTSRPAPQMSPPPMALGPGGGALVAPGGFVPSGANVSGMAEPMRGRDDRYAHEGLPRFHTHGEAERAFMDMLGSLNVNASWTWEQVMRETITEPLYKALKTLSERKAAFEKYLVEAIAREREQREQSLERCRKDWQRTLERLNGGTMMEGGVKSWWSFERAKREIESKAPDVWKMPRNDDERRALFGEFIDALKQKEETTKREIRAKNVDKITSILRSLNLDLAGPVRWQEARSTIVRTPEWHRDSELQKIDPLDILKVFEGEVKTAEKEAIEGRARQVADKKRRARKARDGFKELLAELKESNHIVSGTTWRSIYPVIEKDPRFLELVGQPGSSPLDLFWDLVDELDQDVEERQSVIETVLSDRKAKIEEPTTYDDFTKAIEGDERVKGFDNTMLRSTYEKLHARVVRHNREERRRAERKLRNQIDDLRYAYKKLDPPVELGATYEELLPRIKNTSEFIALDDETHRRAAHEKFMRRLKEKFEERGGPSRHERERSRGYEARDAGRSSREERRRRGSSASQHAPRGSSEGPPLEAGSSKRGPTGEHDDERRPKQAKVETNGTSKMLDGDAEEGEIA